VGTTTASVLRGNRSELLGLLGGFAAAAALRGAADGRLTHKLSGPNRGDELLHAMAIEINRSALEIRLCYGAHAVLLMTNRLAF
jgi:hypothetical protein